ncbi:MAG: DNA polymerase III subunit beta [Methylophilaceae bacterium]
MNIKINRDLLLKPLSNVSGIVEKRHALPILSNLLLEGTVNNQLKFSATDLEVQISLSTQTEILNDFSITVAARKLFDITRALPEGSEINIQVEDSKVIVKAGKSKFNLQTLPTKDYPLMKAEEEDTKRIVVPQNQLRDILRQVDFSMAQQDIRYYLNGLLFEVDGKKLNIVGTDGHRLSFTSINVKDSQEKSQIIIPRKTILELIKLLDDTKDNVEIDIAKNQATFTFNNINLITKVIDGKFPDYNRVIPVGHEHYFEIKRLELLSSMQRASILSNEKYRGIRMLVDKGQLKLLSNNSEQEQAEEEMEISYNGPAIDIGFNVTYLIDVLTNIQSEKLSFAFKDSSSSCLITIPKNDDYKYVVMPMRI